MRTEMDLLNMDERQRLAWFMANRGTVIAVGAMWIGMIGWELTHGRVPTFMIFMVPVFALLRAGLFGFYCSRPLVSSDSPGGRSIARYVKIAAALLLAFAMFLPVYSIGSWSAEEREYGFVWSLVSDDALWILPLAFAFLWPLPILIFTRESSRPVLRVALLWLEPVLTAFSCVIILWIPQLIFATEQFFFVLLIPVGVRPEWGCYLAVAANGLYLISWLADFLSPTAAQTRHETG